jgi:tetratricopeptide (TPR) repeat protein
MNSENTYDLFIQGKKLAKENEHLRAIMFFEKAKKLEPEKGSIREALAFSYYKCGLYTSAKENFSKAINIDAANDYAHYGLGLCLLKEGKINAALGHLKIALAMKPGNLFYSKAVKKYSTIFKE